MVVAALLRKENGIELDWTDEEQGEGEAAEEKGSRRRGASAAALALLLSLSRVRDLTHSL